MYYSIHILIRDSRKGVNPSGVFRHVPIYFCTTENFDEACESFRKACFQIFGNCDDVEEHDKPNCVCERKSKWGKVGSLEYGPDYGADYLVQLVEFSHKPGAEFNL